MYPGGYFRHSGNLMTKGKMNKPQKIADSRPFSAQRYSPLAEMASHDSLTTDSDSYCFAKPGEIYAIMLRPGGSTALDLGDTDATFTVRWFNPRNSGPLLAVPPRRSPGRARSRSAPRPAIRTRIGSSL